MVARGTASPEADICALRERVELLEEENLQLRALLAPSVTFPAGWGLSAQQTTFLGTLYARSGGVSYDALRAALLGGVSEAKSESYISVIGHKTRKKVRQHGVDIRTMWAFGFALTAESREVIAAALAAEQGPAA